MYRLTQRGLFRSVAQRLAGLSFVRYLVTGAGLFLIDLGVFLACVRLFAFDIAAAQLIARTAGAGIGFLGHKYFSFRAERVEGVPALAIQGSGYVAVTLFNIAFSPLVVQAAVQIADGRLVLAKIAAEAFLVLETYILLRALFGYKGNSTCEKLKSR
jgi:putative flippase GtrA